MAELQPNDEFLVNRNNITYTQPQDTLMANLQDTDYLLVNRADATYKITGEDLIDSVVDPLELSVSLNNTSPTPGETIQAIAAASGGKQPYSATTYQWIKVDGDSGLETELTGQTFSSLVIGDELSGHQVLCECSVSDSLNKSVTERSSLTSVIEYNEEVDTPELLTPPDGAGLGAGIKPESGLITDVTVEGPTATMHGLRFDSARETYLQGSANGSPVKTASLWIKSVPSSNAVQIIFGSTGNSIFEIRNSKYSIDGAAFDKSPSLNTWEHVVVQYNNSSVRLYVNGVDCGTVSRDTSNYVDFWIGTNNTKQTNQMFNGYLSDVYFVDGQALEPTAFGKDFDGAWGPLDSSDVKANIADSVEPPYDSRPNYSEKWSDVFVIDANALANPGDSFDGNLNTAGYLTPQTNSGSILTFSASLIDADISIYFTLSTQAAVYSLNGGNNVLINTGEPFATTITSGTGYKVNLGTGVSTVQFNSGTGPVVNQSAIVAIEADGRLLIDGPADNSQVWSDGVNVQNLRSGYDKKWLFDGRLDWGIDANFGSNLEIDLSALSLSGNIKLHINYDGSATTLGINGGGGAGGSDYTVTSNGWQNLGNISLNTLSLPNISQGNTMTIHAIELDGKILIDSPAQWNTSQVWSEGTYTGDPTRDIYPVTQAFDGDLTTNWGYNNGQGGKIEITGAGTGVVRIFCGSTFLAQNADEYFKVNGVDVTMPLNYEWLTVPDISSIQSIEMRTGSGSGNVFNPLVTAIEVDGEILVDGGSFGTNGFYLPFDPAATNEYYGSLYPKLFNGIKVTDDAREDGVYFGGAGQDQVFDNLTNIEPASTIQIYGYAMLDGTISINDESPITLAFTTSPGQASVGYTQEIPYSGKITKLIFQAESSSNLGVSEIVVDGKTLINHNSIGTDDSGNGNNFHDENFVLTGNTQDTVTDTPMKNYAVLNPLDAVGVTLANGNLDATIGAGGDKRVLATIGVSSGKYYFEFTKTANSGGNGLIQIGVSAVNQNDNVPGHGAYGWAYCSNGLKFNNGINSSYGSTYAAGDVIGCALDMDSGEVRWSKNGVFQNSGDPAYTNLSGYVIAPSTADASGYAGNAVSFNAGQQPFAASNVTYDQDTGTVVIDGETYDTLYNVLAPQTATLTIADAGTLGLVEGTPNVTAKVGGATGRYVSHTDTTLELDNVSGTWSTASETAIAEQEQSIAAINPDDFVMSSTAFSATPLETTHKSSTWQVTAEADSNFASPVIDVTSESALTSYNAGGLEGDTIYRARVKHTSTNNVDSDWSDTISQNVFKTEPALLETPDADMHGLRFDHARETLLQKNMQTGSSSWTVSVWLKATDLQQLGNTASFFEANDLPGNNYGLLSYNYEANEICFLGTAGVAKGTFTSTPENQWVHIVVSYNGSAFTFSLNNESKTASGASSYINEAFAHRIGIGRAGPESIHYDGYMSDYYFVDGHALEPTEFGALFPQDPSEPNRRWGPLDSAVVKDNINTFEPEAPYDSRPSYDQKWSDGASGTFKDAGRNATKAFDGLESTGAEPNDNATVTFDFTSFGGGIDVNDELKLFTAFSGTPQPEHFTVNGINYGTSIPNGGIIVIPDVTKLETITMYHNSGFSSVVLRQVIVDGRVLIDGPADNSQVWSDGITTNTMETFPIQNSFDGDTSTVAAPLGGSTDSELSHQFLAPIEAKTSVELWIDSGSGNTKRGSGAIGNNNVKDFTVPAASAPAAWVTMPIATFPYTFNQVWSARDSSGQGGGLGGVRVDGKILIDSPAQWNTSQVWSDNCVVSNVINGNVQDLFKGDTSTCSSVEINSGGTVVLTTNIPNVSTIGLWTNAGSPLTLTVNEGEVDEYITTVPSQNSSSKLDVFSGFTGTISTLKIAASVNSCVNAIQINGEILVDGGSFGTNGFYLPFDPAATGVNWSNSFVGNFESSSLGADKAFDGNLSTVAVVNPNTGASQSCTWTGSIDITTSLRFKVGKIASVTPNLLTNFGELVTPVISAGSTPDWVEFPGAAGQTLTSFTIYNEGVGTASNTYLAAVEVDGEILIDHSSIGTDDSGQDNHFHDQNFAVGNTDEVWSKTVTMSGTYAISNINNGFDGDVITKITNAPHSSPVDAFQTVTFATAFTNVTSVRCWGYNGDTGGTTPVKYRINSEPYQDSTSPDDFDFDWQDMSSQLANTGNTVSSISVQWSGGTANDSRVGFRAIEINGELLIDKNIQDTVLDTPMRNYAVLSTDSSSLLSNGNLEFAGADPNYNAGTAISGSPGKYYAEMTVLSGVNTSSNFVSLGFSRSSSTAPDDATAFNGILVLVYEGFISVCEDNASSETQRITGDFGNGSVVGLAIDASSDTPNGEIFVDGVNVGSFNLTDGSYSQVYGMTRGNVAKGAFNFGQQPFAGSNVTYDQDTGIATLADASPNTSQVWSDGAISSLTPLRPVENIFDGDGATSYAQVSPDADSTLTLSFGGISCTSLKVKCAAAGSGGGGTISVSNTTGTTTIPGGSAQIITLPVPSNSTLDDITFNIQKNTGGNGGLVVVFVEVDGKILVDADPTIDNSQKWSDGFDVIKGNLYPDPSYAYKNAFDGDPSVAAHFQAYEAEYTISFPSVSASSVEVTINTGNNWTWDLQINKTGQTFNQPDVGTITGKSYTYTFDSLSELNELKFTGSTTAIGAVCGITQIKVDGKILVDAQGFPGGTYNTLFQTWDQYATYGLFFYNENTDEIIQKFTLQRRYGLTGAKPSAGIYELAVQPNFAVAAYIKEDETYVPIENPEPRIAAAEAQAAAEVAAAQAETRKYQRMLIRAACSWVLAKAYTAGDIIIYNGHVFRALEDNVATADNDPGDLDGTWEFLGLEEDAAPLAIDGYFPLYETEAVSDAAGNGSSHTHTINGITYYMPDGGVTIYHGNYTGFDY